MVDVALLERARQQHVAGELERAERAYREILDTEPNHPEALHLLGVLAHQSDRDEEAVGLLRQATAAKPGFTKALNNLGSALHSLGRLEEARDVFGEAIALDPEFADAHFNLGVTYQTSKDFDKAVLAFEQALHHEPGLVDAEVNLGVALRNLDRTDDAVAAFRRALEHEPDHPLAHLNLGLVLRKTEATDEAVAAFTRATELLPERADTFTFLGQTLWWQGRKDEAIVALEQAAELNPDSPPTQYDLTRALFELGDPRAPDARFNLGVALQRKGECESALEAFDANLALEGGLRTRELAMKVMSFKELARHEEMEQLLSYDQFLRMARLECPAEYQSLEAFNEALAAQVRDHCGELKGSGGPIEILEQIASTGVGAFMSSLTDEPMHPFVKDVPARTKITLKSVALTPGTEHRPTYSPDAWLAGIYFVEVAAGSPEECPEIEFGCPDPHFEQWMKVRSLPCVPGQILTFPAFWIHRILLPDGRGEVLAVAMQAIPTE